MLNETTKKIHVFADKSKTAYATKISITSAKKDEVETHLVFAKSQLLPVKDVTLLKTKLMASLIALRALECIKKQINYEKLPIFINPLRTLT